VPAKWVNPDPPSFKSLVGKCQRVDLNEIVEKINEGVVESKEVCE
jgi:hypothetical protein